MRKRGRRKKTDEWWRGAPLEEVKKARLEARRRADLAEADALEQHREAESYTRAGDALRLQAFEIRANGLTARARAQYDAAKQMFDKTAELLKTADENYHLAEERGQAASHGEGQAAAARELAENLDEELRRRAGH